MFFQPKYSAAIANQAWSLFSELDQSQWRTRAEIEQRQFVQLRRLLQHCIDFSPYYRDVLQSHRILPDDIQSREDLARLSILSRREYQAQFDGIVSTSLPTGMQMRGLLSTSGTSGVPIQIRQTNQTQLSWIACALRDFQWSGVSPLGSLAAIRATGKVGDELRFLQRGVSLKNWGQPFADLVETGPSHIMDVHQKPSLQLDWLASVNPDYLLSYPSNLAHLSQLKLDSCISLPRLQIIQSVSEALTIDQQRLIESAFGVPVKNTYSAYEAGYIASPCPAGNGLHVHAENVLLEVLDSDHQPCQPGDVGRVVLTTLHNYASPMVRYEIMDEAVLGPEACACGRGLPTIYSVQGKRRPMMKLASGEMKNSTQLAIGLRKIGGMHQFQIIQTGINQLTIHIVPASQWSDAQVAAVQSLANSFFADVVNVQFKLCQRIELSAGGKLIDVIVA